MSKTINTHGLRRNIAILVGVSVAALGAAAPARTATAPAEPQENIRSERVGYADLNLADRYDRQQLKLRVAGAVKRLCLFERGRNGLQDGDYYHCSDGAWEGANSQIVQAIAQAKETALTGHSSTAARAIAIHVAAR